MAWLEHSIETVWLAIGIVSLGKVSFSWFYETNYAIKLN